MLIRVAGAFGTAALQVVLGEVVIDLLALKRR